MTIFTPQKASVDIGVCGLDVMGAGVLATLRATATAPRSSAGPLPAALIQRQRDFFGSHTCNRVDREGTFHALWVSGGHPEEKWD